MFIYYCIAFVVLIVLLILLGNSVIGKAFFFKLKLGLKVDGFFSYAYVFNEIFLKKCYDVLEFKEGTVIFDVGANIGLSTMYFNQRAKNLNIFSFEPVPQIFEILKHNCSLVDNGNQLHLINKGLGAHPETIAMNYLQSASAMSSLHAFDVEKKRAHDYIYKQKAGIFKGIARYFLEKQMDNAVKTNVEITTLSDVISAHQITQIDLLKIDVEGFEENVLQGIQPEHFGIIQYIIIEIETFRKGRKERIMKILEDNHFMIVKEDDDAHWGILFAQKIK